MASQVTYQNLFSESRNNVIALISPGPKLIAHYKMNDNATNTVVIDNIGINNGTSTNNTNTMSVTGKINNALEFDGSTENISLVAGNTLIPDNDSWSISCWFNADVIDEKRKLIEFRSANGGGNPGFDLHVDTTNLLRTGTYDADTGVAQRTIKTISTSNWFQIVATYDGTNIRCYVNGNLELTFAINLDTISSDVVRIGDSWLGAGSDWFDGKIDDIRIYNGVSSLKEIQDVYNSGSGTESEDVQFPDPTISSAEFRKWIYSREPDVKASDFKGYPYITVYHSNVDVETEKGKGSLDGKSKPLFWDIEIEIVTSDRGYGEKDGQGATQIDTISNNFIKTFNNITNRKTLSNNSLKFCRPTTTSVVSEVRDNELVFVRSILLSFESRIQVSA